MMGLGYIGLPTASILANHGFKVHGVDINAEVVATINAGKVPISEPSLDSLVELAIKENNLVASTKPVEADIFIIAVPTPFKAGKVPDISYVQAAVKALSPYVQPGNLIILESTSPVGTTEQIVEWLQKQRPELCFSGQQGELNETAFGSDQMPVYVAHSPERVLPGQILKELIDNDRIIGGIDPTSAEMAKAFYSQFVRGKIFLTDSKCAELCKLTENSFRDVNIAFANELALICETLNIDVWELIRLANRHPRVNILNPGPGVGGHCIAVDPWFIVDAVPEQARLIRMAREINDEKPFHVVDKIVRAAEGFKEPSIACLGLSFKANIDDLRESPAIKIVDELAHKNVGELLVVEPYITQLPKNLSNKKHIQLCGLKKALLTADIIVLLVDHQEFLKIDISTFQGKIVIDTRGVWETVSVSKA